MDTVTPVHRIESALERAGLEGAEIRGRGSLFATMWEPFARETGRAPAWGWWVPGRIEVFGKHTDYAGGLSMVAAVPRGFALVAAPRADRIVSAYDARWSASMQVDLGNPAGQFRGWANYVAVVARRLARNFPGAPLGLDVMFASDLPRAAGLSSSSALVVGVSLALIRRGGLEARPEWTAAIGDTLDLGGYLGAVENGLTFRSLAGTSGVGTHGGSEDHTAILNCAGGRVSAFSYVPTRRQGDAALPADWRFLVMTSGVEAAKAGAARGRYNRASLATRALLDLWNQEQPHAPASTLAEALDADGASAALTVAIGRSRHADFAPDVLDRRLRHFIRESGRVRPALTAFERADRAAVADLAAGSQADAETLLQNQIPETSALAADARAAGAFAAVSFGAGFGGSVWALSDADRAGGVLDEWQARYRSRFPGLERVGGLALRPSVRAIEIDLAVG